MIDRINTSLSVGVDRATKKAANALEKVTDKIAGTTSNAVDNAVLVRLNTAYNENYQQARNAQDSISYMQTRDGALSSVNGMLQDLRDLAVSMGNPILNESDKELIAGQANSIMQGIESFASSSEFNSHQIIGDVGLSSLGLDGLDFGSDGTLSAIDSAISSVVGKRAETGASISTLNARIDNLTNTNINLAEASESYTGSLVEDIVELNQSVTEAMVSVKALGTFLEIDRKSVMGLLELIDSPKD
ncbi:flagellin domain protein [Denitrovibrio acetiphilus DSM 12809]|uniref:Flagellin domain protein n=1 Tax=Denitrovibrio acetiphilus (strain DSM 12809 / NBRC 114555 / N2460) TaxID=522772 RepID=D4H8S8_DENA2|nr:flagellin domain-containing protein [Denitrovibrio acetiphilus]ADD68427.1 flagellin domain protein [Denitrovibrio acetiphilus DSM 12809]